MTDPPNDASEETLVPPSEERPADDAAFLDFREEWAPAVVEPNPETDRSELLPPVTAPPARTSPRTSSEIPTNVQGIARNVELRFDQTRDTNTLTFHLDRYDAEGNRLAPIGVEFRVHRRGQVSEGDEVAVSGTMEQGTLVAERILDLTTGSQILGGVPKWVKPLLLGILGAVVLIVALIVGFALFHSSNNGPSTVQVPAVSGQDPYSASLALTNQGLVVTTRFEASDTVPFGNVIRSEPHKGTSLSEGSMVTLVVSTGPGG
jgi:hypothetical protein